MEFWVTIVGLLRRKRVIIPAVLVGLTLGALAYQGTPKTYASSTTMVLTTTEFGGTESQDPASPTSLTNPMLNFNESLRTTSAILIQAMSTKDVATELGVRRPTRLVVDDGRSNPELLGLNGPFVYIRVESTSPDEAARIVVQAQKLMRQKLKEWQDSLGAPKKTYVSLVDVVSPSAHDPSRARATKLGLMALLFGFLLSMGIAYLLDQRRARRRARATARAAATSAPPPGDRPGPDPAAAPSPPPVLDPDRAEDHDEPSVVPAVPAEDTAPAAEPTPTRDEAEPAVLQPVPVKSVRSHPATTTKRSRPGPAITPKKSRGRAVPTKKVTSVPAAPSKQVASVPAVLESARSSSP